MAAPAWARAAADRAWAATELTTPSPTNRRSFNLQSAICNSLGNFFMNGLIRASDPPPPNTIHVLSEAMWLWGRLRDFDRLLVPRDPRDVLLSLTPQMLKDVHKAAPRVAAWLNRIGED